MRDVRMDKINAKELTDEIAAKLPGRRQRGGAEEDDTEHDDATTPLDDAEDLVVERFVGEVERLLQEKFRQDCERNQAKGWNRAKRKMGKPVLHFTERGIVKMLQQAITDVVADAEPAFNEGAAVAVVSLRRPNHRGGDEGSSDGAGSTVSVSSANVARMKENSGRGALERLVSKVTTSRAFMNHRSAKKTLHFFLSNAPDSAFLDEQSASPGKRRGGSRESGGDWFESIWDATADGGTVALPAEVTNARIGKKNRTLLHFAAKHGLVQLCLVLVCLGVDPGLKDDDGKTAADYAHVSSAGTTSSSEIMGNRFLAKGLGDFEGLLTEVRANAAQKAEMEKRRAGSWGRYKERQARREAAKAAKAEPDAGAAAAGEEEEEHEFWNYDPDLTDSDDEEDGFLPGSKPGSKTRHKRGVYLWRDRVELMKRPGRKGARDGFADEAAAAAAAGAEERTDFDVAFGFRMEEEE